MKLANQYRLKLPYDSPGEDLARVRDIAYEVGGGAKKAFELHVMLLEYSAGLLKRIEGLAAEKRVVIEHADRAGIVLTLEDDLAQTLSREGYALTRDEDEVDADE